MDKANSDFDPDDELDRIITEGILQSASFYPELRNAKLSTSPVPIFASSVLSDEEMEKLKKAFEGDNHSKCPFCGGTGYIGKGMKELYNIRVQRGITVRDLAQSLDILPSRLSELENGINGAFPTQEEMDKIMDWVKNGEQK